MPVLDHQQRHLLRLAGLTCSPALGSGRCINLYNSRRRRRESCGWPWSARGVIASQRFLQGMWVGERASEWHTFCRSPSIGAIYYIVIITIHEELGTETGRWGLAVRCQMGREYTVSRGVVGVEVVDEQSVLHRQLCKFSQSTVHAHHWAAS